MTSRLPPRPLVRTRECGRHGHQPGRINPDAFFLRALERWDTETQQRHKTGRPVTEAAARQRLKMPLFNEIVVRQARPAFSARSVRDAYVITLNEHGALDFGRMAELLGPGKQPEGRP